jgi:hypothetical protein
MHKRIHTGHKVWMRALRESLCWPSCLLILQLSLERAGDMAQRVEPLPSKLRALCLVP